MSVTNLKQAAIDMTEVVRRVQDTLAGYIDPGFPLNDPEECVNALLGIVDHKDTLAKQRASLAAIAKAGCFRPPEDEEALRLVTWLDTPLFEGEDAPQEHAEAAGIIRRLERDRDEYREKYLVEVAAHNDTLESLKTMREDTARLLLGEARVRREAIEEAARACEKRAERRLTGQHGPRG